MKPVSKEKIARILLGARKDPKLTIEALAERHGMSKKGMHDLLERHGEQRAMSDRLDYRRSNLRHSYFKTRRTA